MVLAVSRLAPFFATLSVVLNVACVPDLEATILLVTYLPAEQALNDICLLALIRLMADLVALETELLVAIKRIVSVLAA